ncbi:hypothetical protein [Dactylosporangium sp. CA-139066]|uniref:hypothetical protein n=1 Tax=Dactylosporangium sp. CA-139066 TaxID=3239930 RepID=UPI003D931119
MPNPIDIIANAIRAADGNNTMGAGQLAEVAVAAVREHIAQYRSGHQESGLYEKGWDDALVCILKTLGHG